MVLHSRKHSPTPDASQKPLYLREGRVLICGLTKDGRQFRPSDWAQRLTTAVGRFGPDRRIRLHPAVALATVDGVTCVVVDDSLETEEPEIFAFLMDFACGNGLQVDGRKWCR